MKKIAIFDLDGTLCPRDGAAGAEEILLLKVLREKGMKLAICSGKPVAYLSGLARQLGMNDMILMGENGSVIQFGADYPPPVSAVLPYARETKKALLKVREDLEDMIPDLWFQPNRVVLTPFPKCEEEFDMIQSYLDAHGELIRNVTIFRHVDSFDMVPEGLTKYDGLKKLTELTGIPAEDMIAVGDGVNDIPMFRYAGLSLGINLPDQEDVDISFASVRDALDYILTHIIY